MKIEILKDFHQYKKGDKVDLKNTVCYALIEKGWAKKATAKKKKED